MLKLDVNINLCCCNLSQKDPENWFKLDMLEEIVRKDLRVLMVTVQRTEADSSNSRTLGKYVKMCMHSKT